MYLRFVGANGSMGLKHGNVYNVDVNSDGKYLWVDWGKNKCPYSSFESFASNWEETPYKKGNYEDCIKFIENDLNIRLLDFQKDIIKSYFENRMVITGRGIGRTMCRNAYGKYIDSLMIDEEHPNEAYVR